MSAPLPLYQRIAADLRERIESGVLRPGAQLPTEPELAEQYATTRQTVKDGIMQLVVGGLVVVEGKRRLVALRQPLDVWVSRSADWLVAEGQAATLGADAWIASMAALGIEAEEHLTAWNAEASAEAAALLGISAGDEVTYRRLLREAAGPHNLQWFVFPADVSQGTPLASGKNVPRGTMALLEDKWRPIRWELTIETRPPTSRERSELGIPDGEWVLAETRTGTAMKQGRVVAASMTAWRGSRTRLRWRLHL